MPTVSVSAAKACAIKFWQSFDFGENTKAGVNCSVEAYGEAARISEDVLSKPHPSGPGILDLHAPSAWHAACFLMFYYVHSRHFTGVYSDISRFNEMFGLAPVFRGQARPWDIIPSSWRDPAAASLNRRKLAVFHACLKNTATENADPLFMLFGSAASPSVSVSMAQHYGLPTDLVDFTFDPRIAFLFACWSTTSPPYTAPGVPKDSAVVYTLPFFKLFNIADLKLKFPHPAASRIYRQSGFFVDYGPCPSNPVWSLQSIEKWAWLQQNATRLFFPRTFPDSAEFAELQRISDYAFASEPFIKSLAETISTLDDASLNRAGIENEILHASQHTPPWNYFHTFIQTDEQYVDIAALIDRYIRCAAYLNACEGQHLDPALIFQMLRMDPQAFSALEFIATSPLFQFHSWRLDWIRSKILEAKVVASKFIAALKDPKAGSTPA